MKRLKVISLISQSLLKDPIKPLEKKLNIVFSQDIFDISLNILGIARRGLIKINHYLFTKEFITLKTYLLLRRNQDKNQHPIYRSINGEKSNKQFFNYFKGSLITLIYN